MAGMVELYHPDLDGATIQVSERSAYLYREAGWKDTADEDTSSAGNDSTGSAGGPFDQEEEDS